MRVIARNADGAGAADSAATGVVGVAAAAVPVNTSAPTISGTLRVGETLRANNGTWSNSPTSFVVQWRRCSSAGNACVTIAAGSTYLLVAADAGRTLRVRVIARNADGAGAADSAATGVVGAAPGAVPVNTSPPTITGTPQVGQELMAGEGSWSGSPESFAYQWQRCNADVASCSNVFGATGKSYGVRAADLGYRVRVVVTARNARGSVIANSAITAVVAPVVAVTNRRPVLRILSVRFTGTRVYARFRVCDDTVKNVTVFATESRPNTRSSTRRFITVLPPRPCGVYTRSWRSPVRFRGPGRYTLTLRARDTSGLTSIPARRTFNR